MYFLDNYEKISIIICFAGVAKLADALGSGPNVRKDVGVQVPSPALKGEVLKTIDIRADFPCLKRERNGKPPIYFDNACMTLKPSYVIEKINEYYTQYPACGERSTHWFAKEVDNAVEESRFLLKELINAEDEEEIVFTKNTTEAINIVAHSFPWEKTDIILTTDHEHNSNFIPWYMLKKHGLIADYIPVASAADNTFNLDHFEDIVKKYKGKIRFVSLSHVSNLNGVYITDNEIKEIVKMVKNQHDDAYVMLDGAQSVPHKRVDVRGLGIDFIAFSIHKMMGPTGIGVLYGRKELLNKKLLPFIVGGGVVNNSFFNKDPVFFKAPYKFEAGLQNYAGMIGAGAASRYLMRIGVENIESHEMRLNKMLTDGLKKFDEVEILPPRDYHKRSGIVTFFIKKLATKHDDDDVDIDEKLNIRANIMIRKGSFCVHSWYNAYKKYWDNFFPGFRPILYRASLYGYNTEKEIDVFLDTMEGILKELDDLPSL